MIKYLKIADKLKIVKDATFHQALFILVLHYNLSNLSFYLPVAEETTTLVFFKALCFPKKCQRLVYKVN